MKKIVVLLILLLAGLASAVELDGRTVILLVSAHRSGDPQMEGVKAKLLKVRSELGYTTESMPIVYMGFEDSDTERKYFDRLGFQAFDSPVLCVAEWGNPARFGPKRVLDYAIARSATPQHVDFIVQNYIRTINGEVGPETGPDPQDLTGGLEISNVRFEASGRPVFLTNVGVRLRNASAERIRDLNVKFYCKRPEDAGWRLMGSKPIAILLPGNVASRDLVGDTRDYQLLDETESAVPCAYRVEVERGGQVILYQEGEFVPNDHLQGETLK